MPTSNEIEKFLKRYAFNFKDKDIIKTAFTHSSFVNENGLSLNLCNERLEFLGDAALKTCVSKFLYNEYPDAQEGELTKLRSQIIADKTLSEFALKIGLGNCLILGIQEEKMGGRKKPSILACAFEALLGALFLEFGLDFTAKFLFENFEQEINSIKDNIDDYNPKAILQEYTQSLDGKLPEYKVLDEHGQAHNKTFDIGVYYNGKLLANDVGHSKKEAQQRAAKKALTALGVVKV